jgi:hypothetical protein
MRTFRLKRVLKEKVLPKVLNSTEDAHLKGMSTFKTLMSIFRAVPSASPAVARSNGANGHWTELVSLR